MVRFVTPSVSYSHIILSSIKSKWIPRLFIFSVALYLVVRIFEIELTRFIIPFFPEEADKSFGFYLDFLRLCFNEMLWWGFFAVACWAMAVHVPVRDVMTRIEENFIANRRIYVAAIMALSLVTIVLVATSILDRFPNSADEYVYLYQAEAVNAGALTQNAHPLDNFFRFNHIIQKDGVRTGRFPPGWPLLLVLPLSLDVPPVWLNPILGIITLLVFYSFAQKYYGPRVAFWSLIALAITGYFIFNSASYFSHTSCLLFTVSFIYCFHAYLEKRAGKYAILAGVCLGMIIITRYYNAVLIALPVILSLFYLYRWKAIRPLVLICAGSLPFFGVLLWYNYEVTGNPFGFNGA